MSELNPYAAPLADTTPVQKPIIEGGIYHALNGRVLVVNKLVALPTEICIKSNEKAAGTLFRRLYWHHPAVYIALLANILIYALLAVMLTKKAEIDVGLSDEWFSKRLFRIITAWVILLACCCGFGYGVVELSRPGAAEGLWIAVMLGSLLLGVITAIAGILSTRIVYPHKITDEFVFLRGANPDFARRFPKWPGDV